MATNPLPYDASVIASVNTFTALANSGFLEFYTGSQPALNGALTGTKLAKLPMSATAFASATAAAGTVTATANAITTAAALATGTAGYWALMKSDDATVVMTGSVGTAGADINLNTTSFVSGVNVTVSAFSITEPQT